MQDIVEDGVAAGAAMADTGVDFTDHMAAL